MFEKLENLNNKVVVIAGGVGQVGYATAKVLAGKGARVIALVRRDLESAKQLMAQLSGTAILADVTDTDSIKRAVAQLDQCDILINAVGTTRNIPPVDLQNLTDEVFDTIIDTNLKGSFVLIREFHPLLAKSGDGLIVNISSTAGLRASQSNLAYGAAKAGIDLITKTLGKALGPSIRVVGIAPGYLTNPTSGAVKPPGANEQIAKISPLRRVGQAEDIANAVESVATTMRFVTGQTITIDGGISL
jgi:NAD(P)-dependent dehydrogenase (short-subunit alcohol dehydrogenase family)